MGSLIDMNSRDLPPGTLAQLGSTSPDATGQVNCLAFSPQGNLLASGTEAGVVHIWHLGTNTLVGEFHGHEEGAFESRGITSIAFSPDGDHLVSGGWDDTVRLWDVRLRQELLHANLNVDDSLVKCVAFAPDGNTFAACGCHAAIRLWNARDGKEELKLVADESAYSRSDVEAVSFSPDGGALATSYQNKVQFWDRRTGHRHGEMTTDDRLDYLGPLVFSPNTPDIVVGYARRNLVRVWNIPAGQVRLELADADRGIMGLAVSGDGKAVVTATGLDHTLRLWELPRGRLILRLDVEQPVYAVASEPNGVRIAYGLKNGAIGVWRRDLSMPT